MPQNYPDQEGYALAFVSGELTMNGKIYIGISNVSIAQPTNEGHIKGTKGVPIKRTPGEQDMGEGTVTFSDEEARADFIDDLGDGYRDKTWSLTWIKRNKKTGRLVRYEATSCRSLDEPVDDGEGEDATSGDVNFSFMEYKINGKRPHIR